MTNARSGLRDHLLFSVLAVAALAAAAAVWFGMPHDRSIPNVGVLLIKLIPFVLAVEAIAQLRLSQAAGRILALIAIPACFLVYFTYFVPRIFFEEGAGNDGVYYLLLTLTPFLILSLVLTYRIAGGSAGMARRLGYAMILLQLSGLEDLAYITVNNHTNPQWTTIPEVWVWADHMTVFAGRPLTKNEAFLFIAIHVVLALLILFLPNRFWRRLTGRPGAPRSDAPDAEPSTSDEERVVAAPGR